MSKEHSRVIEDVGFLAGLAIGVLYVLLVEILPRTRSTPAPPSPGFPTVVVIIVGLCVAPKMLGRATTGRIWTHLADRIPLIGRLTGGQPKPPDPGGPNVAG